MLFLTINETIKYIIYIKMLNSIKIVSILHKKQKMVYTKINCCVIIHKS